MAVRLISSILPITKNIYIANWASLCAMEDNTGKENTLNPLSPNSDQQQFSPNNVHTLSKDKVVRIQKMITKEKMPWCFIKFSQLILKGNVWRSVWRICVWILGLNGLNDNITASYPTNYTSWVYLQCAKKVVSDSPGLVDFAIRLVIFVVNLLDRQVLFLGEIQITEGL